LAERIRNTISVDTNSYHHNTRASSAKASSTQNDTNASTQATLLSNRLDEDAEPLFNESDSE
jgi:hypothetical protein